MEICFCSLAARDPETKEIVRVEGLLFSSLMWQNAEALMGSPYLVIRVAVSSSRNKERKSIHYQSKIMLH